MYRTPLRQPVLMFAGRMGTMCMKRRCNTVGGTAKVLGVATATLTNTEMVCSGLSE